MKSPVVLILLMCSAIAQQPRTVTKISSNQAAALVDTNDAPDLKEWGNKAGTLCVGWSAMFLEWVEKNHTAGLVTKLNAALRQGEYNDALWMTLTGQTVDELWKLFARSLTTERMP